VRLHRSAGLRGDRLGDRVGLLRGDSALLDPELSNVACRIDVRETVDATA